MSEKSDYSPAVTQPMPEEVLSASPVARASGENMERFARTFEASAKRWELVVYPSLVAFIILAAYGFYLIYNLSRDVHQLVGHISIMTTSVKQNMDTISDTMVDMAYKMDSLRPMSQDISRISGNVGSLSQSVENVSHDVGRMSQDVSTISQNTALMTTHTAQMGRDLWNMSQSIGKPLNTFNSFFPWTSRSGPPMGGPLIYPMPRPPREMPRR